MGSVEQVRESKEGDVMKVGDDFELTLLFDFVSNPSTHGSLFDPLSEGVDKTQQGRTCGQYCKVRRYN